MKSIQYSFLSCLLTVAALLVMLTAPDALLAQEQPEIQLVDCEAAFPVCKAYVASDELRNNPSADQIEVRIDGQPVEISPLVNEDIGVQLLFAFDEFVRPVKEDPTFGVRGPGLSGQPRYVEFEQSAMIVFGRLESKAKLQHAWLAAMRTGQPGIDGSITDFPYIVEWVRPANANEFINTFIDSEWRPDPDKDTEVTPLFGLTEAAVKAFGDAEEQSESRPPASISRHILLFSDGYERVDTFGLDPLIREANQKNIHIHTIMLGNADAAQFDTLQNVARQTGGLFTRFESAANLDEIMEQIVQDVQQTAFTFEVPAGDVRQLQLVASGQTAESALTVPTLQDPTITIVRPSADETIERAGSEADATLATLTPTELLIEVELNFADGFTEERTEWVEYELNDITRRLGKDTTPTTINFPIETLDTGEYTLRVRVKDKYQGTIESEPMPVRIEASKPPPLTSNPSVIRGFIEQFNSLSRPIKLLIGLILLILLLLFFLPILLSAIQRLQKSKSNNTFHTSDPNDLPQYDATIPDDATEPASDAFPIASLFRVRGDSSIPEELALDRASIAGQPNSWTIGRSFEECNIIIDDRRVSRLHAVISEVNGQFTIRDEGSAGGTYITSGVERVRQKLAPLEEVPLKNGDVINFNSVSYRFEIDKNIVFSNSDTEPETESSALDTEPEYFDKNGFDNATETGVAL